MQANDYATLLRSRFVCSRMWMLRKKYYFSLNEWYRMILDHVTKPEEANATFLPKRLSLNENRKRKIRKSKGKKRKGKEKEREKKKEK